MIFSTIWNPFAGKGDSSDNPERFHWNEGGTLHEKNLFEWTSGTERDRLATAADFAYVTLGQKLGLENVTELDTRPFAEEIVKHLNELSSKKELHQLTVRDAVAPFLANKLQE